MKRRKGIQPISRQTLAVVAIFLAVLSILGIQGPWIPAAVILLALIQLI